MGKHEQGSKISKIGVFGRRGKKVAESGKKVAENRKVAYTVLNPNFFHLSVFTGRLGMAN